MTAGCRSSTGHRARARPLGVDLHPQDPRHLGGERVTLGVVSSSSPRSTISSTNRAASSSAGPRPPAAAGVAPDSRREALP